MMVCGFLIKLLVMCYAMCNQSFSPHLFLISCTSAWLSIGSPSSLSSTWDTVQNLSARHLVQAAFAAACRFDRMLFSSKLLRCLHLQLACTDVISVLPTTGSTTGLPQQLHASDHWGVFGKFEFLS
jgi:hypothetical protein